MIHADKHNDDAELLRLIKKDDSGALKILFEKYFSALCFFASHFVKNTDLAEEVVSDIFLNVWLKRGKIQINVSLKSYLYTAVRNQSLNYLKKKNQSFEDIEVADREGEISYLGADDFIFYQETKDEIETLLQKLPEKREIIFRMNRLDGLSYKEIAEILSISVNTVQNQMVKAVKFLSEQYPKLKKLLALVPFFLIHF